MNWLRGSQLLCDVDGTIADWRFRPRRVENTPEAFLLWHKQCWRDGLNPVGALVLESIMARGKLDLHFVTARPAACLQETHTWLTDHFPLLSFTLHMRDNEDLRQGQETKREWAVGRFNPANVLLVLEDDVLCVEMWRQEGYNVLMIEPQ